MDVGRTFSRTSYAALSGAANVRVSEFCMVYANIPSNLPANVTGVPTVGFLAHVDTSPAITGANVKPIVHRNYQGGDIVLPGDPTQVITVAQNPILAEMIGDDVITTDGTTLLGSDDQVRRVAGAGDAWATLVDVAGVEESGRFKHGPIAVGFTADEEIGAGIDNFDVPAFGADFAYTIDGGALGEVNEETWSAQLATVTFHGKSTHPGTAKGVMVNSIHALADFLSQMPHDMLPETTEDRVGFVHPYSGVADVEESSVKVLLRDFELSGLDAKEQLLRGLAAATEKKFAGVTVRIDVKENYKNMKEVLKDYVHELIENACVRRRRARAGVTPFIRADPRRNSRGRFEVDVPRSPVPEHFHGRVQLSRQARVQHAARAGKDGRDDREPRADLRRAAHLGCHPER